MDTLLVVTVPAIVVLLMASAFFAGSETALTAVSHGKMHQLEKDGSRAAAIVNRLVEHRQRLIGALLLGNTFVNILASSLATSVLEDRLRHHAVLVVTILMTLLILVFAEVLPKTLAIARTDRVALAVAGAVRIVVGVLGPVVGTVQYFVWRLLGLLGAEEEDAAGSFAHDEIRGTVSLRHQEGTVERESRDMITGVLDLRELTAGDVMIHRKNMMTVSVDQGVEHIVRALLSTHHARVPVWREQPENIVGVLHTRDIVRAVLASRGALKAIDIAALVTPPWFVPETMALEELLDAFREKHSHFALVVDEYGVILGLVTREDILDEVFGRIPDEHGEMAQAGIRPQPDGSYYIDGVTTIRDVNRALDWNLPDEAATTLAGLVIHEARTIPDVGQRFAFYGFKFEILRRQRNQITALRVIPPEKMAKKGQNAEAR
ncbi:MAG: HlyC/CorC family transporter [Alphaproteobacteria bacterium]|nr:HlyC/CorC family transporter [Alphaproteobacteria bacterium]MDE2629930.1 HlyC/CorC family transporter [Alphaproteobacteria bacterium]